MRSSVSTLQNHYLKNGGDLMQDKSEEVEPKQQQEIIKNLIKL